jgi:hypothetical protein
MAWSPSGPGPRGHRQTEFALIGVFKKSAPALVFRVASVAARVENLGEAKPIRQVMMLVRV